MSAMEKEFRDYMAGGLDAGTPTVAGAAAPSDMLDEITHRYPWFATARILRQKESGAGDPFLDLHLTLHPVPGPFMEKVGASDFLRPSADDIIDRFLSAEVRHITPNDSFTEEDAAAGSSTVDTGDGLVTEELAEVFLNQGMISEAKEIYSKLGLLYPEKSIYFAEIIKNIGG